MDLECETTDVLICGCGPVGAMLSAYLGRASIHNVVLEKETDITTDPRGIALDEDGIRSFQGLGLYDSMFTKIGTSFSRFNFVGGVHHDLHKKPMMRVNCDTSEGVTGHVYAMSHKQPELEAQLRSKIASSPYCDLRGGSTLTSIEEIDGWVYATYVNSESAYKRIKARFLVGADGKTGFTRKHYLEPRGIQLLWAEATKYQETWVALNWKLTLPTPYTHPQFPLWKLGYTPEQVYGLFFPTEFRFLCNPQRSAVCGRFGPTQDRLYRFEFVVQDGEDEMEMSTQRKIEEVVLPYYTHPGSRYGLSEDVQYPLDCIEVLRCRPFRFSARSCDKWALGRVIVCGDAAHVFPPFGGQGIASGFRDAIALSWRLALACRSAKPNVDRLITPWYMERKQQLEASLATTVYNGNLVTSKSPLKNFIRDWALWLLQLVPSIRTMLELGPRQAGRTKYQHSEGMPFIPEMGGGVLFSQTFCASLNHVVSFTDDVIFAEGKKALFQLVILIDDDIRFLERSVLDMQGIDALCPLLRPDEATIFVHRRLIADVTDWDKGKLNSVYRTASGEEFWQSSLCLGRPPPVGYREHDMWKGVNSKRYVILRSDRFVFAACDSRAELEVAARRLNVLFPV